jgi:Zn-dependent metalloprotease
MKTTLCTLSIIAVMVLVQSCKKDGPICNNYTELNNTNHLVDISVLKSVPQMLDTLAKYPNLQAASITDDEYMTSVSCNYFYNRLKVFGASYTLCKSKKFGYFDCLDYTPKVNLPNNLVQNIDDKKAIEIAKKEINLTGKCLTYQLGYSYQDTTEIETTNSYKLVWNIESGSAYVIVDATNGTVYSKFDGMYTNK